MRRHARRVWLAAGLLATWGFVSYVFPAAPRVGPLHRIEATHGPALVIAPHSDDESLAAGGLLQQLEGRGSRPYVLLVTAGDGFRIAAELETGPLRAGKPNMVEFGRRRLGESRSALAHLGLGPERLLFLGYPDGNLHRLWLECWRIDQPCSSTATGRDRVPYEEARTPGSPYAGAALLEEIEQVLRELRPAMVVYPHPNEAHVDHWGLANFVTAALEDLRRSDPSWVPPEEWFYLVHRGDWPAPKGYRPADALLPPEKLTGGMTTWRMEPLTSEAVERKNGAVHAYGTQTAVLRRYMESFVRSNELFGTIDRVYLPNLLPPSPMADPAGPPWGEQSWVRLMTDPRADTIARFTEQGADIYSVWAARDRETLYLAARMGAHPRRPTEVRLAARWYSPHSGWVELTEVVVLPDGTHAVEAWPTGHEHDEISATLDGPWARLALPLRPFHDPVALMVNVETRVSGVLIDRSAWRPLSLDGR